MTTHPSDGAPDPGPVDLSSLRQDVPPAGQEARVRAALRARGTFAAGGVWARRAAAAVLIFAAGLAVGVAWEGSGPIGDDGGSSLGRAGSLDAPEPTTDPEWALVLLDGPDYAVPASAAEREQRVAALAGWARELAGAGRLVFAEELAAPVRVVPREDPATERSLGLGLFVIRAATAELAAELAADSPHLRHGGRVAVQPIIPH